MTKKNLIKIFSHSEKDYETVLKLYFADCVTSLISREKVWIIKNIYWGFGNRFHI